MEYFKKMEEDDGVRWTWHMYPNKQGKERNVVGGFFQPECVVPLACVITPLKTSDTPVIQGEPSKCKQCGAVANACCRLDYESRSWTCAFCRSRNTLQATCEAELSPEFQGAKTIEYQLPRAPLPPPTFIFILDIACNAIELEGQKKALLQTLSRAPADSLIGLITVGRFVSVYELGFDGARCVVLTGVPKSNAYPTDTVRSFLGIKRATRGNTEQGIVGRYLVPLGDAELALPDVMEGIQPDPWPPTQKHRLLRATGPAVEVATGMAELLNQGQGQEKFHGRILLFTSGPACKGQGKVVSDHLDETIRQYQDINEGNVPHLTKSTEFGVSIAKRLKSLSFALDMFMIALDQVGLLEYAEPVAYTGGYIISTDSSEAEVFTGSLDKMFEKAVNRDSHNMFFETILEVQTSSETKIAGCIGPCRSMNKMSSSVSTTVEVGEAKTCAWKTSVIDQATSFTVVFDAESGGGASGNRYAQFITSFVDSKGHRRLRVTTVSQRIATAPTRDVMNSCWCFDQLTAAAVLGKMAAKYMEQNNNLHAPVLRWLDRSLIKFVKQFSTYAPQPGNPDSLQLLPQYTLLPQFLYHLRRSEFLQVFNCSVDETVFFRASLFREAVQECVIMLQPTLYQYTYGASEGEPVLLDSKSLKHDNILFCDAYFDVTIHHGRTIAEWRDQNYHLQPGYEAFNEQLKAPHRDMEKIMAKRFPAPKITICDQNGSQARYLLNKLNPSDTQNPADPTADVQVIHTEDPNLQTFMKQLKRLATKAEE